MSTLYSILSNVGSIQHHSAVPLRQILSHYANRNLNTGAQHDTVELLGYLLNQCPNQRFTFETLTEYRFISNGSFCPCPTCHEYPDKVPAIDKILRLTIPQSSGKKTLNGLLRNHFSIHPQADGRQCTSCKAQNPNSPRLPYGEKFNE